ncbi:MAG TPA: response regulator [Polyangiaceae bacterium]|jgi:DNA-binding NtrC family response regulator|nr:response regulator [Polyangiaceae bacterium]
MTRIILAEDDDEMRDVIASSLRKDGYHVTLAKDGGELLARLAYQEFDVVISDIRMPVCSGTHVLDGLRDARWQVPVILMTAFGDPDTRAHVESRDAILFDKPFDVDDLRTAVMNLVHDRKTLELLRVVTCESSLEAWSAKWMLQSERIDAHIGERGVYVNGRDYERALDVLAHFEEGDHRDKRR